MKPGLITFALLVAILLLALALRPNEQMLRIEATPAKATSIGDVAVPHEDMLLSPCPVAPSQVPRLQKRIA